MNALKNGDSKVIIVVLGTLAAFGFIVIGAVFFAILMGLGMNEDLAWGLSVLMWLAVVAVGIVSLVYFFDSIKKRVEQVIMTRSVVAPPTTPEIPKEEAESKRHPDQPSLPTSPPTSYRSMLLERDKKEDPSE